MVGVIFYGFANAFIVQWCNTVCIVCERFSTYNVAFLMQIGYHAYQIGQLAALFVLQLTLQIAISVMVHTDERAVITYPVADTLPRKILGVHGDCTILYL